MWIDEFLELMSGSTISHSAIDMVYALKNRNLSSKLYKFRAVNDYAISNLETDTVWVCSADKYNDPYECATTWCTIDLLRETTKANLDKICEQAELEKHLSPVQLDIVRASHDPMREIATLLIGKEEQISEEDKQKMLSVLFDVSDSISQQSITQMNEFVQRGMKICSFSSRVDSVVMWGHYADSHTGFAIEYDVTTWPMHDIHRRILHPVIYRQELFDSTKYHLQAMSGANFNNLFGVIAAIHKSPDWSYEGEWRFVLAMGESFPDQNYPMPKPSGIYLGTRTKPEDKKKLLEIAARKKVPVYQMSLSTSEFKLVAQEVRTSA